MSLPSGYKRLEFVRSSGTQYIDLGVKPNRGYAIEIKAKCSATSKQTFGGCDTSWKSNGFMLAVAGFEFGNNANTSLQNYGSEPITLKLSSDGGYKNGSKTWDTSSIPAFQATANFTLCALNRSGTPQEYLSGDTYYCKIWDDSGTLIRDCIPCESTSGVVGLWDDANNVFYTNSGTGTFVAGELQGGPSHTLIGGTAYEIKGGNPLVNGTKYSLKKGRTLIDGVGYDIKFQQNLNWELGHNPVPTIAPLAGSIEFDNISYYCPNTSMSYNRLNLSVDIKYGFLEIVFRRNSIDKQIYGGTDHRWYVTPPVIVQFSDEPTGDLLAWLEENAVRQ